MSCHQELMDIKQEEFISKVNKVSRFPCSFKVGDLVSFINEFGVVFDNLTIFGFADEMFNGKFIYLFDDCYWFPASPESLSLGISE